MEDYGNQKLLSQGIHNFGKKNYTNIEDIRYHHAHVFQALWDQKAGICWVRF